MSALTCREYHKLITPAVDRYLSSEDLTGFFAHTRLCAGCRTDYELETTTKLVVRRRVQKVRTPAAVTEGVVALLAAEVGREPTAPRTLWATFVSRPFVKPVLGLGLAAATVMVIIQSIPERGSVAIGAEDDVVFQSFANYRAVLAGTITPQVTTDREDLVEAFFAGKTGFPVKVMRMSRCKLVGGVLNSYLGAPLAHLLYRRDGEFVYVYQACWETVQRGSPLSVREDVRASLNRTGWFTDSHPDGSSIAMWTTGRTLCAAVARMSQRDLLACLEAQYGSGY